MSKNQSFKDKLLKISETIILVDQYVNSKNQAMFKCLTCDNQWKATPNNILRGRGCPECAIKSGKYRGNGTRKYNQETALTHDNLISQLLHRSVKPIDQCINSKTPITFECTTCLNQWKATPNNILSGRGCPHCKIKLGELKVEQWLNQHNIQFESQKTFDGLIDVYKLRVDFYIPELNTVIEVDGEQHRHPISIWGGEEGFKNVKKKDQIKNQFCEDQGIRLIRMKYARMKLKEFNKEFDKLEILL